MRTILSFIFFTLLSLQPVQASPWDTPGAARAFEEAQLKRSHIEEASQPDLSQYLDCAKTYRKVYLRDPHYEHAPDAIYEEAIVYQQMGDKFGNLEHYRTAARRFQFLVKDYGGNRNCPDALVRLVTIYAAHLKDEDAALEAFQRLKQQYDAKAAVQAAQAEISREPVAQQAEQPTPSTEDERSTEAASVQNIRCWSTNEYTRVIIGLDIDTPYKKALLSKPDRIYFDFANTKLGENLSNRTFTVEDEFLKQVRVGQNHPRVVRVVLDVAAKQSYTVTELHDPFRIVVDFPHQSAAKANLPATPQSVNSTSKSSGEKVAPKHETDVPQAAKQAPLLPAKASDSARQDFGSRKQEPPTAITEITSDKPAEGTPAPTSQPMEVSKTPSPAVASPAVREIKQAGVPLLKDAASSQKTNVAENTGASRPVVGKPDLNATPKAAAPTSLGDRTLTRMLGLKVGRIVIDPGHGGHDFGTTGPGGLLEKDLVLSLARQLKRLIEENMYGEVILTRDDDSFVSLEERTAIANSHHADLFISIHANSSRYRSISGVETYYLDFAKTAAEREVAARENASAANTVSDLENLIKKIAQADKSAESRELASILQTSLYSGTRKLFPSAQNRGVRKAPFVVLIGANMPSVLAEVAFLSNPKDEKTLNKGTNQEALAKALFSGIERYIKALGSNVAQNQRSPK